MLRALGWRIRTTGELAQAVRHYQRANLIGAPLKIDGIPGPKTLAALRVSEARRVAGEPTASDHFSFIEFACKCGGRYPGCARIWVTRQTIRGAEDYRRALGYGVAIRSGCRCWAHNKAVGGATSSRHMRGEAIDFAPARSVAWFTAAGLFRGLGHNPRGLVRHGDFGPTRTWAYSA